MALFLIAFAGGAALTWLCETLELIPWRRAQTAHWAERARVIHPARVASVMNEWAIPALAVVAGLHVGQRHHWLTLAAGAYAGWLAGGLPMCRALVPDLTARVWLRLLAVHLISRVLVAGVFIAAAWWMPAQWSLAAAVIGASYLILQLALVFGLGLRLLRAARILVPASPRLQRIVDETAASAGVVVRATWELRLPLANAYASTPTGEVIVSSALLQSAPDDELRAVCRHEIAHLTESRWIILSRIIGTLVLMPLIFLRPVVTTWGNGGLALMAGACALLWILRPRFVQALERRADRQTIESVPDATAYARVLERMHRLNQVPAVLSHNALNTHPNLYDRMLAANVPPDFPRPEPPSGQPASAIIIVALGMFGLMGWLATRG